MTAAQAVGVHYFSEEHMEMSSLSLHLPELQVSSIHVRCWARPPGL